MEHESKIIPFPQKREREEEKFVNAFREASRMMAIEQLGEGEVDLIDMTFEEFAEYDFDLAQTKDLISSIGGEDPRFNIYHCISYAWNRSRKEFLDDPNVNVSERFNDIFQQLRRVETVD